MKTQNRKIERMAWRPLTWVEESEVGVTVVTKWPRLSDSERAIVQTVSDWLTYLLNITKNGTPPRSVGQ